MSTIFTNNPNETPNDSAVYCERVREAIKDRLITANFGDDTMRFLPESAFDEVADHQIIDQILIPTILNPEERYCAVGKLKNGGKRIFATFIWGRLPPAILSDILAKFEDALDQALPLVPSNFPASFSQKNIQNFIDAQKLFLVPLFTEGGFRDQFSEEIPIPIQYPAEGDPLGRGAEGEVFNAEIIGGQQIPRLTKPFALKVIANPKDNNGEHITLQKFSGTKVLQHDNIASIHSGFQFKGKLYLIADRADSGNLEKYMEANSAGANSFLESQGKQWLLQQMHGLATALKHVHTGVPNSSITHHDIKPDNILVHSQPSVMFKITDWGCSSVKDYDSSTSNSSPRNTRRGNPTYCPPEARDGKPTSRKHDVWSLGCVFLELLIWYTGGLATLKMFRENIDDANSEDFCQPDEPGILLDAVTQSLFKLETIDNEGWRSEVGVIRKMLATDPGTRIIAAEAANLLSKPSAR